MLCKCHWIVLYTVHFTVFSLGGPFFHGHGVDRYLLFAWPHSLSKKNVFRRRLKQSTQS